MLFKGLMESDGIEPKIDNRTNQRALETASRFGEPNVRFCPVKVVKEPFFDRE